MSECGEKVRHPTRDDALAHIKRLVWKNHSAGQSERSVGLAAYPCEHCHMWHVGHQRSTPLVWHYTVLRLLDPILESDALRPPAPRLSSTSTGCRRRCVVDIQTDACRCHARS